jgi:exoribonuclease R
MNNIINNNHIIFNEWKLTVNDKKYTSWKWGSITPTTDPPPEINPIAHKLFTEDIILENGELVYSPIRDCKTIAGVLLLENNRTFGRTNNGKRLLYKCIPDNKRLPEFLVPYSIPLGFSKDIKNKYVVFKFDNWNEIHPNGILVEVLGNVNELEPYYEYQIYCKNLNIQNNCFSKKIREIFPTNKTEYETPILENSKYNIENRIGKVHVLTIDPENSQDFDDGFSITKINETQTKLSIYISNVFLWFDTYNLWDFLEENVSTIYLPNKRRPMLPTILSNQLCSLLENQPRFAFCMDIIFNNQGELIQTTFGNVLIQVSKNYIYEEPKLLKNKNYQQILELTKLLSPNIKNSFEMVEYWMVYMNKYCGKLMLEKKIGIFRNVNLIDKEIICKEGEHFDLLKNWKNINSQYVVYSGEPKHIQHDILGVEGYVQITSPIRRLVDLLNQTAFILKMEIIQESKGGELFFEKWSSNIQTINQNMKSTAKIERECVLMHKCMSDAIFFQGEHEGIVLDYTIKNEKFVYFIYLKELKHIFKLKSNLQKEKFSTIKIKMYKFQDEYNINNKIRFHFVMN